MTSNNTYCVGDNIGENYVKIFGGLIENEQKIVIGGFNIVVTHN